MLALRASLAGGWLAVAAIAPSAASDPDEVAAVEPGGPGILTKCRGWFVATSCRRYHHINLPSRIAVGDTISISFGSHPKDFQFFVARIALKERHCAIFSEAQGDRKKMDKINVSPCYRADKGD